jgi:hypothetical protein
MTEDNSNVEQSNVELEQDGTSVDNKDNMFFLGKKAFISALVAIALNPLGIVIGYTVARWLHQPDFSAPFEVTVDAQTRLIPIKKELLTTLTEEDYYKPPVLSEMQADEIEDAKIDASVAEKLLPEAQAMSEEWNAFICDGESNLKILENWKPGITLAVIPMSIEVFNQQAPQTIAERSKKELQGIYESELKDTKSALERLDNLIQQLNNIVASNEAKERTGICVITVGVLNSGDAEGVIYPNASLNFSGNSVALVTKPLDTKRNQWQQDTGGYTLIPPHIFRRIELTLDSAATKGGEEEKWKKFVQAHGNNQEITVILQTSNGELTAKGHMPLY